MSLVRVVCEECGEFLRDVSMPMGVEVEITIQIPMCHPCRSRAIEAAFEEGVQDGESHFAD
jgi:hypothetical protein